MTAVNPAYSPDLPTGTDYGFSYEYGADVFIPSSDSGAGAWQPIRRITAVDPQTTAKTQDAATYDDKGADNAPKVGESWTLGFQIQVQRATSTGIYLPEVEHLHDLAAPDADGERAFGRFRWYDKPADGKPNPDDAYEGYGTVQINRGQTGNDGIGSWSVTITGRGRRKRITNPFVGWVDAPTDGE